MGCCQSQEEMSKHVHNDGDIRTDKKELEKYTKKQENTKLPQKQIISSNFGKEKENQIVKPSQISKVIEKKSAASKEKIVNQSCKLINNYGNPCDHTGCAPIKQVNNNIKSQSS